MKGHESELVLARTIGRSTADLQWKIQKRIQRVAPILNRLNPLSTTNFTVSDNFLYPRARNLITQAVKDSHLPENVYIATPYESTPPKPYVVITHQPSIGEQLNAYRNGARKYVTMVFDSAELTQKLDE